LTPDCPTLKYIPDQGGCGSCWAHGAATSMSDRMCIHSDGKFTNHVSAENLLSCCYTCGFGCNGGFPGMAWSFWTKKGLVTGGDYGTNDGCQPYEIKPCEHHVNGTRGPCETGGRTPKCHRECENPDYKVPYEQDLTHGKKSYNVPGEEKEIMNELVSVPLNLFSPSLNLPAFKTFKPNLMCARLLSSSRGRKLDS
jgi:cathepsin B